MSLENVMARKQARNAKDGFIDFPREADTEFDVVADEKIAAWNGAIRERFGIGEGNLQVIEDVCPAK